MSNLLCNSFAYSVAESVNAQFIAKTLKTSLRFKAKVFTLKKEEGGRKTGFVSGTLSLLAISVGKSSWFGKITFLVLTSPKSVLSITFADFLPIPGKLVKYSKSFGASCISAAFCFFRDNHFTHNIDSVFRKKHMLCPLKDLDRRSFVQTFKMPKSFESLDEHRLLAFC